MKANQLYRDVLKRMSAVSMHNHTREGAQTELRRAISLIEFLVGERKAKTPVSLVEQTAQGGSGRFF